MIDMYIGLPGTGKSTAMHDQVKEQSQLPYRFWIHDKDASWGPDGLLWRGKPPRLRVLEQNDSLPSELPEQCILVFRNWDPLVIAQRAIDAGNGVFVSDEIDTVATKDGWMDNPLRRITHEGRHLPNAQGEIGEMHIWGACRRPQNLHPDIIECATQVFLFRTQGYNTIKRLVDSSIITPDEVPTIESLPNFHFRYYANSDPKGSRLYLKVKPIKVPA